jgi:hypothetical protein
MLFNNGSRYDGYWENDEIHGYGRLIHPNGDFYEGEWRENKAQRKGKYVHSNGTIYEGDWIADLQHGYELELWSDGAKYEGEYREGKKHGIGRFKWDLDGATDHNMKVSLVTTTSTVKELISGLITNMVVICMCCRVEGSMWENM